MKKKNGFTLIELLAVIVIMGILMLVAIPAISRVIENSRKDTFVDIAKSYVNSARNLWATDGLTCEGRISSAVDDGDYYILINTKDTAKDHLPVLLDQGGKSSWGNRNVNGYVRVNVKTTDGVDSNGDGIYEVEPKRTVKFYVALTDGTHGLIDDNTKVSDNLVRGDIKMELSESDLKKIQLTVDDGKLDCAINASGGYDCTAVTPIRGITGVCVDDQTSVGVTGNVETPSGGGTTPSPTLITATIDISLYNRGTATITALEGMTWEEWIDSDYNTLGMVKTHQNMPPNVVAYAYSAQIWTLDNVSSGRQDVYLTDTIITNGAYWVAHSGGSN